MESRTTRRFSLHAGLLCNSNPGSSAGHVLLTAATVRPEENHTLLLTFKGLEDGTNGRPCARSHQAKTSACQHRHQSLLEHLKQVQWPSGEVICRIVLL